MENSNLDKIPAMTPKWLRVTLTFVFIVGAFLATSYAMFQQGKYNGAIEACQTTGLTYYASINETNGNLTCLRQDTFLHNQELEEEKIKQQRQRELDEVRGLNFTISAGD